jgi:deoxyribonuclease V
MKYNNLHSWNISPKKAIAVQKKIRGKIVTRKLVLNGIRLIAGVDVSFKNNLSRASIVILTFPDLKKIETITHIMKAGFPYIPGLLSFREGPVILECVKKLTMEPDVFIFDAQGLAHPRKAGLACHMGVILNKPSVGSAKSHLYGKYRTPGNRKGNYSLIRDENDKTIGAVLRTRDNTNPVFVSPGHLTDIKSSLQLILTCSPKYKIPEPIRAAHAAASLR